MKRMILAMMAALAVIIGLLGFTPVAQADTGKVTITAHVEAVAIANASASASATGAVSAYSFVGAQIRSKAKTTRNCFWSRGYNSTQSGWFWDGVPSKVCKLKHPTHFAGHKVFYKKVGGGTTGRNCGNWFRPVNGPKTKAVVLDAKAGTTATVAVKACARATVSANVAVTLGYTYNGVHKTEVQVVAVDNATASNCSSSTARVKVTKHLSLKTSGNAIAKAKASATASAKARATASAVANAEAKARVSVDLVIEIPIGPTPPPPPTPTPILLEASTINDVLVNNSRTIGVTGIVPVGHTATLFATAKNGGSIISGKNQSVGSGQFTGQVTYLAPSEVPSGGHDQVSFTLTLDNGRTASISTNQFEIRPAPVDPL